MNDDRYEIKGKIGQGGIGAVYRAYDRRLNRDVAIKRVLPEGGFENQEEAIEHLLKEAKSLSSVQHPHIVTVYDAGVDEEGPYVVMEVLEGRTLDEMIERGSLTFDDFRDVALQTQEALIAAQDLNLVHRDLKPTNVMVTWLPSGRFQMKLVDFGLAKFSPKPSLQTIDHGDAVFGSIHFMAPEQFERTPLDQRTDMYSMGCMYYFALTGLQPFGGETAPEVMASHLQHRVTPLEELRPDLPPWVCEWVMWHIEREMDKRPSNARESLQNFLMSDQQNPETPEEQTPEQPKRPRLVFPGAEPPAATPAVPPTPEAAPPAADPAALPPPAGPPPAEVPTGTVPQPIEPPVGQQPSLHKTSQVTTAESAPAPAPSAPAAPAQPIPPAAVVPPAPAKPPAPAAPPAAAVPPAPVEPAPTPAPPLAPAAAPPAPAPAPATTPAQTILPPGTINLTGPTPPPAAPPQAAAPAPAPAPGPPVAPGAPGAAPAPATLISGSTEIATRKGMSNATKFTIAAVLVVAIIFVGIIVLGKAGENKDIKRGNELLAQVEDSKARDIPTTDDDVRILLRLSVSLSENSKREAIYQRLLFAESSDGTDLDALVAGFASNVDNAMTPDIRNKLFKVIQGRKAKSALGPLIEHARSAPPQTATAALLAAEAIASDEDLGDLLSIIQFSSHQPVRLGAKRVIASLAIRSEDPESLGTALKSAYESATDEEAKRIFIELLGSAGGKTAAAIVKEALKSKDTTTRLSAIAALGSWADDTEFETLLDYLAEEEDDNLRKAAFNFAFQFLKIERNRDEIDLEDMWKMLAREAELETEKLKIVTGLASIVDDWAFAVVEFFVEDKNDKVSFKAEQALERMEERRARIKPDGGTKDDPEEKDEEPEEKPDETPDEPDESEKDSEEKKENESEPEEEGNE